MILFLGVTLNSIIYGNPFTSLTFGILSIFAAFELIKGKNKISTPKRTVLTAVLLLFVLIGFWYPEFVNANMLMMLLLSPLGIIPCPTLIVALSLLNIYYPKVNKGLYTVTTLIGALYAVIGVFLLNVYLDVVLLLLAVYSLYNLKFLFKKVEDESEGAIN